MEEFMVNLVVPGTIGLIILAVIAVFALSIYNIIQNPKTAIGILVSLIGIVAIFLIGYVMAGGGETLAAEAKMDVSAGISRMIGAILNMVYIMVFIVIGVIIWGIFKPLFS